jgi:hypothetical protein
LVQPRLAKERVHRLEVEPKKNQVFAQIGTKSNTSRTGRRSLAPRFAKDGACLNESFNFLIQNTRTITGADTSQQLVSDFGARCDIRPAIGLEIAQGLVGGTRNSLNALQRFEAYEAVTAQASGDELRE